MGNYKTNPFTGNADYWWYKARAEFLEVFFGGLVKSDSHILDVGSADGPSVSFMEKRLGPAGKKTSMDIEPEGLKEGDILGSVEAIPIENERLDIVSAFDVLEHVKNEAKALDEIHRVLKPGGYVFISVPAYQWAWSKHDEVLHHYRRYSRARLISAIQEAGFHEVRSSYGFFATFPLFVMQRITAKITKNYFGEAPKVSSLQEKMLLTLSRVDLWFFKRAIALPWGSSVLLSARKPLQ